MDNFDDVEQEVMLHDADDVSAVVRELVEMPVSRICELPLNLQVNVFRMRAVFEYHEEMLNEKAQQKRIIHRYGQAE